MISLKEIRAIILVKNNIKHKCIVSLIYSSGLRRSELLNVTLQDIVGKPNIILLLWRSIGIKILLFLSVTFINLKSTDMNVLLLDMKFLNDIDE